MDYSYFDPYSDPPSSFSPVPPQPLSPFSPYGSHPPSPLAFPIVSLLPVLPTFLKSNMATDTAAIPVNGTYAGVHTHGYEQTLVNHNTNVPASTTPQAPSSKDIPKDQVAWYFVEQYYTTMSRNPEKLPLFYNKRSQFVFGVEDEKVPVCSGKTAIEERIRELKFQDAKVRVTNVDSQVAGDNIVIQVIGAMSNRSEHHRKFVQTFNLAPQNNGYYVLNDIFRYLLDEEEETGSGDASQEMTQMPVAPAGYQEPGPTEEETEPKSLTSSSDPMAQERDASLVDTELEEVIREQESEAVPAVPAVNGTPASEQADVAKEAPVAVTSKSETSDDGSQTEQLKDPELSPAPQPKEPAKPAAPVKPPVPRTWAQLASSNRPAAPSTTVAAAMPSPTIQAKPSLSSQVLVPIAPAAVVAPTTPAREPSPAEGSQDDSSGGWQTAGAEHSRKQSRSQAQPPSNDGRVRAYVKNVYPEVGSEELKNALSKHGEIVYFDISRQKNSAFVEFATRAGFQAAVAANPHKIANHDIFVEERRVNQYPSQRSNVRGNRNSFDSRTGSQGRGNFNKDANRGSFTPRGRGGSTTPRGRGTA